MRYKEFGQWNFRKHQTLEQNISYWARRMRREGLRHKEAEPTSKNVAEKVFHGVTGTQKLRFANCLNEIAKQLKQNNIKK